MLVDNSLNNLETDLLLPQNNYKSLPKKNKTNFYQITYFIYLCFLKKVKIIWQRCIQNLCCCYFENKKPKHICFFPKVETEINYDLDYPSNIIYWGKMNQEEVFFTEEEQLAINNMKERIKKSN